MESRDANGMPCLPAPGRYVVAERWRDLPTCYVDVLGPAACGGLYFDAVFWNAGMHVRSPGVRLTIRVAVDGSWRCARTYLPVNIYGETYE